MGITKKNEAVMIDIFVRKDEYPSVFDYVLHQKSMINTWKVLLFENDFNQWLFAKPYYENWQKETGMRLPIIQYSAKDLKTDHYGSDKESRIMNLVYPHQSGSFIYSDKLFAVGGPKNVTALTGDAKLYLSQYISFGKNKKKLDGLDAAATAFIMLPRYIQTGSFQSLKKYRYRNNEDNWLNKNHFSFRNRRA